MNREEKRNCGKALNKVFNKVIHSPIGKKVSTSLELIENPRILLPTPKVRCRPFIGVH